VVPRIYTPRQERQDVLDIWLPIEALGAAVTPGFGAWTTFLARSAAAKSEAASTQANAATARLAEIESQRRHNELCPRLRVTCEPWGSGVDILRLRVALVGPPGLNLLDRLTVTIRDDHFRRGEHQQIMGGPTQEQIKAHIWGPYRFTPGTGPDDARADPTGRKTVYDAELSHRGGAAVPTGAHHAWELDDGHEPARLAAPAGNGDPLGVHGRAQGVRHLVLAVRGRYGGGSGDGVRAAGGWIGNRYPVSAHVPAEGCVQVNDARVDGFLRQLAQLSAPDLRSVQTEAFQLRGYEGERTINYFNQATAFRSRRTGGMFCVPPGGFEPPQSALKVRSPSTQAPTARCLSHAPDSKREPSR
jgi:hypothetical protein